MRFMKSVSISLTAKILSFVIAVPTSIIIARYLGPEGKGVFAVLTAILGVALQFGNLGFHSSSVYFSAKNKESIPSIAGILIVFGLIVGLIIGLAVLAVGALYPQAVLGDIPVLFLVVTLVVLPFAFIAQFMQNLLLGMNRIYEYNFVDVASKYVYFFAIVFLFYSLKQGILAFIIVSTILTIITNLSYIYFIKMNTRISLKFDKRLFGDMLRYGFKAYISAFFAFLVIRSDMLLVNYYIGTEGAGLYSLAVNLTDWLLLVPATIAAMLFPKASSIGDARSALTKKVSRHTVVLMGGICLVAAIFAHPVITLAYGGAFKDSVAPFLFLLPGIFFLSLQTLYMQDFAARGMPPIVYISPALGFVVNIGLNLIMIPKYGILGASVTSSCAYFLMFTINFIYFIKVANAHSREVLILNKTDLFEFWAIWRNKAQAIISK